jgi:copper chaperone CopZ
MPTLKLIVRGMHDENDERRVQAALLARAGVYSAVVSRLTGCVEIDFEDDEVTIEALADTARAEGFEARFGG